MLDKQEYLTKLIISSAHFKFAHTIGNNCCKAEIRIGYVILGLENSLKTIITKCLVCQKHLAIPLKQQISALPSWRMLSIIVGFTFVGPFDLNAQGRVKARPKTYLLLITCQQTRAVQLELTEAMTM